MRIGVLSDTHATSFDELPRQILDALSEVDLIVHLGDFVTKDVLDGLKRLKPVRAVRGNKDSRELQVLLPEKEVFSIGGKTIGITHGFVPPSEREQRVRRMFAEVDIILYGHTHVAQNEVIDGVIFSTRAQTRRPSASSPLQSMCTGR